MLSTLLLVEIARYCFSCSPGWFGILLLLQVAKLTLCRDLQSSSSSLNRSNDEERRVNKTWLLSRKALRQDGTKSSTGEMETFWIQSNGTEDSSRVVEWQIICFSIEIIYS